MRREAGRNQKSRPTAPTDTYASFWKGVSRCPSFNDGEPPAFLLAVMFVAPIAQQKKLWKNGRGKKGEIHVQLERISCMFPHTASLDLI
jgi:hypothetical protein